MKCPSCGSRDIDFQEAGGQSICVACGTVVEENTIVSSIEFQETGDRSHVVGQFVAANCSKPYMSSSRLMGRHLDNRDSKETTLLNARRILTQISSTLRLPAIFTDRAHRLYQLALQRNYSVGRRQANVLATCLYVICRQEKSPHLLIDFSDALQINVYLLGKAFLHFTKIININLEVIDPSLYIHRYADKLDLGDKTNSVITASLRIITRLKKDWIVTGRRPDGVCAAALLIAARAHEFSVTQDTIAQLFRISMDTVRKRVLEFKFTPSAQLTMQQFFSIDLDASVEFDPPAFIRNKLLDAEEKDATIGMQLVHDDDGTNPALALSDLAQDKIYRTTMSDDEDDEEEGFGGGGGSTGFRKRRVTSMPYQLSNVHVTVPVPNLDRTKKTSEIIVMKKQDQMSLYDDIYTEVFESAEANDNARSTVSLLQESTIVEADNNAEMRATKKRLAANKPKSRLKEKHLVITMDLISSRHTNNSHHQTGNASSGSATDGGNHFPSENSGDNGSGIVVRKARSSLLNDEHGTGQAELDAVEDDYDEICLSDSETRHLLLTEEESQKRALLFDMAYGAFMEQRARKKRAREQAEANQDTDRYTQTGKLRKKFTRKPPTNTANGNGDTSQQAALAASRAAVRGASKKINYDALQGVFGEDGSFKLPDTSSAAATTAVSSSASVRSVAGDLVRIRPPLVAASAGTNPSTNANSSSSANTTSMGPPLNKPPQQLPLQQQQLPKSRIAVGVSLSTAATMNANNHVANNNPNAANTAGNSNGKAGGAPGMGLEVEDDEDDDEFLVDESYQAYGDDDYEDYS